MRMSDKRPFLNFRISCSLSSDISAIHLETILFEVVYSEAAEHIFH
jgi:hypothetical protein